MQLSSTPPYLVPISSQPLLYYKTVMKGFSFQKKLSLRYLPYTQKWGGREKTPLCLQLNCVIRIYHCNITMLNCDIIIIVKQMALYVTIVTF